MGNIDHAAAKLAELHQYFLQYPITGPVERRTGNPTASAPLNLTVIDHIHAAVAEVANYTRAMNPAAGPLPRRVVDAYDWCRRNTQHLPEAEAQRRETMIYRQCLENAILAGDDRAVRPIRCPACRTFGLMWAKAVQRAVCTNTRCMDQDGLSISFTLAQLAHKHVAAGMGMARTEAT